LFQVAPELVRELYDTDRLSGMKIGEDLRFDERDLEDFRRANTKRRICPELTGEDGPAGALVRLTNQSSSGQHPRPAQNSN